MRTYLNTTDPEALLLSQVKQWQKKATTLGSQKSYVPFTLSPYEFLL
jgi:hypothetical protein